MPERPIAYVHHLTPRRLRLRIPERRHDAAFFEAVRERLAAWDSVEGVEVNPATAGVLVHFSDPGALMMENVARNDLFEVVEADGADAGPMAGGAPVVAAVRQAAAGVDRRLRRLSGGQGDLRSLALMGLLGLGVVQLMRGNIAVPALTLFWQAGQLAEVWKTPSDDDGGADGHG